MIYHQPLRTLDEQAKSLSVQIHISFMYTYVMTNIFIF